SRMEPARWAGSLNTGSPLAPIWTPSASPMRCASRSSAPSSWTSASVCGGARGPPPPPPRGGGGGPPGALWPHLFPLVQGGEAARAEDRRRQVDVVADGAAGAQEAAAVLQLAE